MVHKGAFIGANATVVCRIEIGKWALIAAGTVVTKNVPDYALMAGVSTRRIGWVCECGHVIDDNLECSKCGRKYVSRMGKIQEIIKLAFCVPDRPLMRSERPGISTDQSRQGQELRLLLRSPLDPPNKLKWMAYRQIEASICYTQLADSRGWPESGAEWPFAFAKPAVGLRQMQSCRKDEKWNSET